jgi:hypothetical protein
MTDQKWTWSIEKPNESSISGDITRLFRAEGTEQVGVLARNAPSNRATLFAREAIQNSWDAARELRMKAGYKELDPFQLRINFRLFLDRQKLDFVEALGLHELAERANFEDGKPQSLRNALGLFGEDCLSTLMQPDVPLSVMYFIEKGSMGMPGNWELSESRMMFALNRVGYNKKAEGSGGSFGYGKAGLIQASRIRVVVAYSCFEEDSSEPGVTRRLLGATYWGQHSYKGQKFTGWVRLGQPINDSAKPLENERADEMAKELGIELRDPQNKLELGTTFVIVDPDLQPHELKIAVERNWWPSMVDSDGLQVQIELPNGDRLDPAPPVGDPDLGPFVEAYSLATKYRDEESQYSRSRNLGSYKPKDYERSEPLGRLGLVADIDGWTFPETEFVNAEEGDTQISHESMVALVRGPRMVVQYWTPPRGSKPYVRGVFVASSKIDDLLRQTEPKAHDKWDPKLDEPGIHPAATKFAAEVVKRLREQVQEFRDEFRIPPPPTVAVNLPTLDALMRLLSGGTPPPPPKDPRPFKMLFSQSPQVFPISMDQVSMKASASFSLAQIVEEENRTVDLFFEVNFVEDSRSGSSVTLEIKPPDGFVFIDQVKGRYRYRGELTKSGPKAQFDIHTIPYSGDWTTKLAISGELVK